MLACISGVRLLLEVVDFLATAHYFIDLLIAVFALYCTKPLVGFTFSLHMYNVNANAAG